MKISSFVIYSFIGGGICQSTDSSDVLQGWFEDTKVFFDNFNSSLFGRRINVAGGKSLTTSSTAAGEFVNAKQFNLRSIDEAEAKKWLKYAAIAYCPEDLFTNWACPECKDNSTDIERFYMSSSKFDNSGFVIANKKEKQLIVGYKGTKTTINWVMNVKSDYFDPDLPVPYNEAKIHSGFYEMAQVLYPDTKKHLTKLLKEYPDYKLLMTGHSMGGALATVSAFNLVMDNITTWDKISLITYGQPRVGNQEFADYLNSQNTTMTRVNREGDPVPTVPTPPLYYHHGHNFYIHFDNTVSMCFPTDISWNCNTSPINMGFDYHFSFWDTILDSNCGIDPIIQK